MATPTPARMIKKDVWLKVPAKKSYGRWEIGQIQAFNRDKPTCKANEIAVKLTLEIPDSIFDEASYELRATLPSTPKKHIEVAELTKEVGKALSERMGMKVKITMKSDEPGFEEELARV